MTRTLEIADLAATEDFGRRLGALLFPGTVVALVGPLGAGKTHLTRAIAEGLGVRNPAAVNSPTFVLIQEYPARLPVYHFDAYRLSGPREFAELGVDEYFHGDGVCVVEWADKVEPTLPPDHLRIEITVVDENRRWMRLVPKGPRHSMLVRAICGITPDDDLAPAILRLLESDAGLGCDFLTILQIWVTGDGFVVTLDSPSGAKSEAVYPTAREAVAEFLRLRHARELGYDYERTELPGGLRLRDVTLADENPDRPGPPSSA
ncbi:tRNA (adenosine(37)-N6)-threonylcarbamoyltransferase complex ATPase subunit type 1 TsaE [bacterium]|nr:tRNA (adenosine(37)-N6)-threonylcarbamoyltransferase complex ATPase subunit type 1 TsaE [bacterium]